MNLVECYILKVLEKVDVTEQYKMIVNPDIQGKVYNIHYEYDCYGSIRDTWTIRTESEWDEIMSNGYLMG